MNQDENRKTNIFDHPDGSAPVPEAENPEHEAEKTGQGQFQKPVEAPQAPCTPPFQPVYPPDSPYSQPFYRQQSRSVQTPPQRPEMSQEEANQAPLSPYYGQQPFRPGHSEPACMPQGQPPKRNIGLIVLLSVLAVCFVGAMAWLIGIGVGNLSEGGAHLYPDFSSGPQEQPEEEGDYVPQENPDAPVVQIAGTPESPVETAPQEDGTYTPKQIYSMVSPSVVSITIYQQGGVQRAGYGSGVILSEDGYIVTNAHVLVSSNYRFVVQTSDGRDYEAQFIAASTRYDLGVLKIDAANLTPAQFGDSDQVSVGDEVFGIGNPAGPDYANSLSHGLISGVNRSVTLEGYSNAYYLQTDAAINPGNSGGALINAYGQVIGISNSKVAGEDYEGMGFAIPSSQAIPLVNEMMRYGKLIDRVKIGATFLELDDNRASIAGLPMGLYVNSIEEGSGLEGSGIEVGDVVTSVEGQVCRTVDDLRDHMAGKKAGDTLALGYYDASEGGEQKTAEVRLIEDVDSAFYR